jgi:2-polyprenyl-6-hydroxyphenyl methylase/3-demethylubiquinone-9 3-methyltransferase
MMTANYDPQELSKFASLAAHWWDPAGEVKMLHQINPIRVGYIEKKASLSITQAKVIDLGCGGGILTESIAALGCSVTGIDLNKALIEVAKLHQLESGLTVDYIYTSAEAIAIQQPACYDVVTCLELLEHVPDPQAIVKAAARLVKPNGHVFFSTVNRHPKAYLLAILGAEYLLNLLPKNTHDYAKLIRPSMLASWAIQSGLIPQEIQGVSYNPLNHQFKFTEDLKVNYLFHAIRAPL